MKKALLIAAAASTLFLLQACGGGGGDGGDTSANPPGDNGSGDTGAPGDNDGGNTGNTGSVSASFQRGSASRYMLLSPLGQTFGTLSSSQQATDGAMTTLNSNRLAGAYAVQDIAGDASFALGRWVKGDLTLGTDTSTLNGTDGKAYHYLAYQMVSAFPGTALHCANGSFTAPTYTGGGSQAALTGSATGTADITLSGGNTALNGSVTVSANGETATLPFSSTLSSPSIMPISGQFLTTNGAGTGVQLADAGNGAYALAVGFAATMPSGARYIGVGRLSCAGN
jgi:hypothetical protein